MYNRIKDFALFTVFASAINALSYLLKSTFLETFYSEELIPVILTLLAINIANVTLIAQNIQSLPNYRADLFSTTFRSLKNSIYEQIGIIAIATILLVLLKSPTITSSWIYAAITIKTLITVVFIADLDILRDTGTALFKIIEAKK